MDLKLEGKTALVTGATAGIGLAIAQALVDEGATVTITGRNQAKLDTALNALQSGKRGIAKGVVADAATSAGADSLIEQLPDVDILVNNLGIYESKPFAQITDEDWQHIFEVNVLSGVRVTRNYLPKMLKKNWGRVIFISSEAALAIPAEMIHYAVTKTALLSISRGLAEKTRGTGVTVNAIISGPTRSAGIVEFLQKLASKPDATPDEAEADFFKNRRTSSLLQRLIEPEEIAHLVAYVASPLSAATNGTALRVEGGLIQSIA